MLRMISQSLHSRDAPAGESFAWRPAIGKTLHSLLDAVHEGLAAHREYERLMSMGMRHESALRGALSETCHCRQVSTRRTSITRQASGEGRASPLRAPYPAMLS
jgi:hypothetical protein